MIGADMGRVLITDTYLSDTADAIREKLGVDTTYLPSEMAEAIRGITGGADLTSADEGKVVVEDDGSYVLQAQTSRSVSANGTYDTTTNNSVIVNVPTDGSSGKSDNDLLFHFDNDTKNSGKTPAAFLHMEGYELSDEQSKFGTHSLKMSGTVNGTAGAVFIEDGFSFGTDDFTIDLWAYPTYTSTSGKCVFSFDYRSIAYFLPRADRRGLTLATSQSSWAADRVANMQTSLASGWHHIAITRASGTVRVFVDGVKEDEFSFDSPIAETTKISFGTSSSDNNTWGGYIDEFRVRLGEAVWTEDFTPPTQPYA